MKHINLITRVLLCIFLLTGVVAPSFSQRQRATGPKKISASTQLTLPTLTMAKWYMVIAYFETKPNYQQGMSEEEFVNSMLTGFNGQAGPAMRKYLKVVYGYHKQNMNPHDIYLKADEKAFVDLYNDLAALYKPQMTQAEYKRVLGVESFDHTKPRNWWTDLIEKIWEILKIILRIPK